MKAVLIEGIRNVGKSYLLNNITLPENTIIYKYPFNNYFENSFKFEYDNINNDILNSSNLHYYSFGNTCAILDLIKNQIIKSNVIIDRSFISDFVFGIYNKRIDFYTAQQQYEYIKKEYRNIYEIIYFEPNSFSINNIDNRNKDNNNFNHYSNYELKQIYDKIIKDFNILPQPWIFKNNFDGNSIDLFQSMIDKLF